MLSVLSLVRFALQLQICVFNEKNTSENFETYLNAFFVSDFKNLIFMGHVLKITFPAVYLCCPRNFR
jgi:hypothetical protein